MKPFKAEIEIRNFPERDFPQNQEKSLLRRINIKSETKTVLVLDVNKDYVVVKYDSDEVSIIETKMIEKINFKRFEE